MSWTAQALGIVAGILTTSAFVPQVIQLWRTRSARDVSALMFAVMSLGVALWLAYGILLGLWPVILANGITLGLSLSILLLKVHWLGTQRAARPGTPPRAPAAPPAP